MKKLYLVIDTLCIFNFIFLLWIGYCFNEGMYGTGENIEYVSTSDIGQVSIAEQQLWSEDGVTFTALGIVMHLEKAYVRVQVTNESDETKTITSKITEINKKRYGCNDSADITPGKKAFFDIDLKNNMWEDNQFKSLEYVSCDFEMINQDGTVQYIEDLRIKTSLKKNKYSSIEVDKTQLIR